MSLSRRGWILLGAAAVLAPLLALLAWASAQQGGQPAGAGINAQFGEIAVTPAAAPDFALELYGGDGDIIINTGDNTGTGGGTGTGDGTDMGDRTGTGDRWRLSDRRGQVVLVDFWASWCAPCRQEADALNRVYADYAGRPVAFVGVNIWDTPAAAAAFLAEFGVGYPTGPDAAGAIILNYGVRGIPEKFFIDAGGRIRHKYVGPMPEDRLRATLDALLSETDGGGG